MENMMNVTTAQLTDCVKAAQRMRETLRNHLTMLKTRVDRASQEGRQIPSEDNLFFYVADAHGAFHIQQDAAFIVESVLVMPPLPSGDLAAFGNQLFTLSFYFEMALVDANSGRSLTGGFRAFSPVTAEPLTSEETSFASGLLFVPITGCPGEEGIPNVDDWKPLRVEYIIPRGSVIRAEFSSVGAFGPGPNNGRTQNPDVVLMGYKVF